LVAVALLLPVGVVGAGEHRAAGGDEPPGGELDVVDIDGEVLQAVVAEPRRRVLVGPAHLEQLEAGPVAELDHPHGDQHRIGRHADQARADRALERRVGPPDVVVQRPGVEGLDEEARRRLEIGHGDAEMIDAANRFVIRPHAPAHRSRC
jgi:hypothetical protein